MAPPGTFTILLATLNQPENQPFRKQILESIYVLSEGGHTAVTDRMLKPSDIPRIRVLKLSNNIHSKYIGPLPMSLVLVLIISCMTHVERIEVSFDRTDDCRGKNPAYPYPKIPILLPQLRELSIEEAKNPGGDPKRYPDRKQTLDILRYLKTPKLLRLDIVCPQAQEKVPEDHTFLDFLSKSGCELETVFLNDDYFSPTQLQHMDQ
jgi:hypothetical protein